MANLVHVTVLAQGQEQAASVTGVIRMAFDLLLTPVGFVAVVLGAALLGAIAFRKDGAFIGGAVVVTCMTMMYHDNKFFDNTLVEPLNTFRNLTKVVTFGVLFALALNLLIAPGSSRRRKVNFVLAAFLFFQTLFLARLAMNGDFTRAGLGWVADLLLFATLGVGFAKKVESDDDVDRYLSIFGFAAVVFIVLNSIQLAFGYRNAVAGNRLLGISGNPQLLGYICATFIVVLTHLFSRKPFGSWSRWIYGVTLGFLALFLLWSGSRTALLCAGTGLLVYFRFRIGRFAIVLAVGAIVVLLAAMLFSESFEGIDRFVSGENTRRGVWLRLLDDFRQAPVFGTINMRSDENISSAESTYLSTLSLMGISGGIPLAFLILGVIGMGVTALRARRAGKVDPDHADLMLAAVALMLVGSVFEGFFLGILAYAVVWNYIIMGLSTFFGERLAMSHEEIAEVNGLAGEAEEYEPEPDELEHADVGELHLGVEASRTVHGAT
jgi:hypothetical protein